MNLAKYFSMLLLCFLTVNCVTVHDAATANNKVYLLTQQAGDKPLNVRVCEPDAGNNLNCRVPQMSGVSK